jgi:hypothetical protein
MNPVQHILFCENPLESNEVDPDYEEEFGCAKNEGFDALLFNFEHLTEGDADKATRKIKPAIHPTSVIYRGWMLTPSQYDRLYRTLTTKNVNLINTPTEYQNCHYLPDSLAFIEGHTPRTVFEKIEDTSDLQSVLIKAASFGEAPVIVKDYVKSEKHDWDTACYVHSAADTEKLGSTIRRFIELRDKHLNEGIVIREFVMLKPLAIHSKSGMPLTEEYRLFFYEHKLLGIYEYWEEGDYTLSLPDTSQFEKIARGVESKFFSMDIARKGSGELIIIELGDGQVAGLPDRLDKAEFYQRLKDAAANST